MSPFWGDVFGEIEQSRGEFHLCGEQSMQIGFFAVGAGPSADPELLALAARAVEQCGFHSLWTGEHVVLVSQYCIKISLH